MKNPLKRARPEAKSSSVKTVESEKNATQKSVQTSIQKPGKESQARLALEPPPRAGRSTPAAASAQKLSAKKPVAAKAILKPAVFQSSIKKSVAPAKTKAKSPALEITPTLRATKKRAPKDLANQYGASDKAVRAALAEAAPRKRRNAATRAKLQSVITPDDGLLLRLARAGAISSAHVPESSNGVVEKPFRATVKRRPRKWKTRCGKCGVSAQYASAAALCVKCGAILIRD